MPSLLRVASLALAVSSVQGLRRHRRQNLDRSGGHCCWGSGGCTGCEPDPHAWCNSNETACTGSCNGNWCNPPWPYPTPSPTPPPSPTPVIPGTPVDQHGFLSVSGNQIVGEDGSPVQLRGMSLFWSQWMGKYWSADTVNWLVDDWHITMIRAAMGVDFGAYLENPALEKAKLETVVNAAIAKGIYVIIDWHDSHADEHIAEAKNFFDEMATKYGGHPHVLFEPFNEPAHQGWSDTIKPYHEQLVPVIRAHTNNVIILGTSAWAQAVDVAAADPVPGVNLAYTFHFFAGSHNTFSESGQALMGRAATALARNVAIFATEWGTCDIGGPGADYGSTYTWLGFLEQHNISHANWAIGDHSNSACAALMPGASASGGWAESQLTVSGSWNRRSLRNADGSGGCCKIGGGTCEELCYQPELMSCHFSESACAECSGTFDASALTPSCGGVGR